MSTFLLANSIFPFFYQLICEGMICFVCYAVLIFVLMNIRAFLTLAFVKGLESKKYSVILLKNHCWKNNNIILYGL